VTEQGLLRLRSTVLVFAVVFAACTQQSRETRNENEHVTVEQAGSAVSGSRVGAAAVVRVGRSEALGPIHLELAFVDRSGDELATTKDSLPFCRPGQDCWWAATFFTDDYGGRAVARVVVRAGDAAPFADGETIRSFTVRRNSDGTIRATAPGVQGTAYVIASSGDRRWGTSIQLDGDATVAVPPDILPPLDGERLRGFFYAGTAVPGD
jgi:hypothetical protein